MLKSLLIVAMASFQPIHLPDVEAPPIQKNGIGSWYGAGNWHGSHTANGEKFRPKKEQTCAHRTLPMNTVVMVEVADTKRKAWCRINDRGPYMVRPKGGGPKTYRGIDLDDGYRWVGLLDLSKKTAQKLGTVDRGIFKIHLRYWEPPNAVLSAQRLR